MVPFLHLGQVFSSTFVFVAFAEISFLGSNFNLKLSSKRSKPSTEASLTLNPFRFTVDPLSNKRLY